MFLRRVTYTRVGQYGVGVGPVGIETAVGLERLRQAARDATCVHLGRIPYRHHGRQLESRLVRQ